jgi:transcriptional regulator with XRE-family HTH domain
MDTNQILAELDSYSMSGADEISKVIAGDFKHRRIEKNMTREDIAEKSGVAISNIARFEQKGLISLKNLIELASSLGYLAEVKNIFSEPKFSTMEELTQIRKNTGKKKAYRR